MRKWYYSRLVTVLLVTGVALVWETVEEELKKSALNLRERVIFTVC